MATKKKKTYDVTVGKLYKESGASTVRFTWDFKETTKYFDCYEVQWMYKTTRYGSTTIALDNWIMEEAKSVKKGTKFSSFSIPNNAIQIGVRVRALGTKKSGKRRWTGVWSSVITYNTEVKNNIKVPDDPEITQNSDYTSFQLSVKDYKDDSAGLANAILFQIQYTASGGTKVTADTGNPTYNSTSLIVPFTATNKMAACWYKASPGVKYNVRAAGAYYKTSGSTKILVGHSDWTKWSDDFYARPSKPTAFTTTVLSPSIVKTVITKYEASNTFLNGQAIKMKHDFQFLGLLDGFNYADLSKDDIGSFAKVIASGEGVESNTYIFSGIQLGAYKGYVVRVRTKHPNDDKICSDWYTDNKNISIGKEPDAPTIWSQKSYISPEDNIALYWAHNASDGGIEKAAKIQWKYDTEANFHTITISNSLSMEEDTESHYMMLNGDTYTNKKAIPDSAGFISNSVSDSKIIKWRVSTSSVSDKWSPWSNERELYCFEKPKCYLTSDDIDDGGEVTALPLKCTVSYTPTTQTVTVLSWAILSEGGGQTVGDDGRFVTYEDGQTIVSNTFYGPDFVDGTLELNIDYDSVAFVDGQRYTLKVTLYTTAGMECSDSLDFIFNPEDGELYDISINNEFYDTRTKVYTFYPNVIGEDEEPLEGYHIKVYRINYDDSLTLLPTETDSGEYSAFIYDPHPTIGTSRYRIIATDKETGYRIFIDHEVEIADSGIIIQWDEHWFSRYDNSYDAETILASANMGTQSMLVLPYNVTASYSNNKDVVMVEYIGRKHPVAYCGTQLGESMTLSSVITRDDTDSLEAIRRLNNFMGSCYIREPGGEGFNAIVKITHSISYNGLTIPINIEATRVEGDA